MLRLLIIKEVLVGLVEKREVLSLLEVDIACWMKLRSSLEGLLVELLLVLFFKVSLLVKILFFTSVSPALLLHFVLLNVFVGVIQQVLVVIFIIRAALILLLLTLLLPLEVRTSRLLVEGLMRSVLLLVMGDRFVLFIVPLGKDAGGVFLLNFSLSLLSFVVLLLHQVLETASLLVVVFL